MKKTHSLLIALAVSASVPLFASAGAATGIDPAAITPYSQGIVNLINGVLVPLLLGVAFFVFVWGIFKAYIYQADNETERAKGHQLILWGVIGFVIIFSVWALVGIVRDTFRLTTVNNPPPPTFNTSR